MLILGGGGEGVRVRLGDGGCPGPIADPVTRSEKGLRASSLEFWGMLLSALFSALTRFDAGVFSWCAVPDRLGVSVGKSG